MWGPYGTLNHQKKWSWCGTMGLRPTTPALVPMTYGTWTAPLLASNMRAQCVIHVTSSPSTASAGNVQSVPTTTSAPSATTLISTTCATASTESPHLELNRKNLDRLKFCGLKISLF